MTDESESAPIPSIQSLKFRFEQLALDNAPSQTHSRNNTQRRPPPPPPKKFPLTSPLLRPVPPPAPVRTPDTATVCDPFSVGLDQKLDGTEQDGPLGGVSSLRNTIPSPMPPQSSTSPSPRPVTPRLPTRPQTMTSPGHSVAVEQPRPALPPRHPKPSASSVSPSLLAVIVTEAATHDVSPPLGNVAALRNRFLSQDPSQTPLRDDNGHNEPRVLVSSPTALHLHQSSTSSLLTRADSQELPGSSNSSIYSPFSEDESDFSEVSLSLVGKCSDSDTLASGALHNERTYSGSSSENLSSSFPPSKPRPPPRPTARDPPRPPRRPNGLSPPSQPHESSSTTTTPTQSTVPLPPRRLVQEDTGPELTSPAPPLPARPSPMHVGSLPSIQSTSLAERKPIGSARLPPPPTRTIGIGDKLPPPRRVHSLSSDEESGSEEARDPKLLPDSSRSSRRPPSLPCPGLLEHTIHVPAHSGHVAATGTGVVVASGHHIRYYDLSSDAGSSWTLDTRDGMRSCLVSCIEFRPAHYPDDGGKYLWVGTKEGHLLEIDLGMGVFTSSKMGIHASQVTNIFRHGSTMITVDEVGKALVFDPSTNSGSGIGARQEGDINLVYTTPRVYRMGEKVGFVKFLGGLLWTAIRADVNGIGTVLPPVIRIYDVYAPGTVGHIVTPGRYAGAVTSGTVLPSHPDHVYLGHEGGYISVWNIATDDGIPACVDVVKTSGFDVLCLEGVNDRLWAGGRKGTIAVYDVSLQPWVVTNCWQAHGGLPVLRIFVDPYALEQKGKLVVVSVGRDEQIKLWDGLLGVDRIEQELLKRERAFSTFRKLNVLIVSWNVDAAKPEALVGEPENVHFLHDVLTSVDSPDIISFGFQEVIDLESSGMAAKIVLLGGKRKGEEGKINENVTTSYRRWHDRLIQAVNLAMPPDSPYTVIYTESLVGLFTCMFVKNSVRPFVRDAAIATIKRGMGGHYGNKGGILARLVIDDSSLCFINCHLAAGHNHVRERNADVAAFLEDANVFPAESVDEYGYIGGGDGSMVLDHEIVFLNGDMNYRIDQRREAVIASIQANDLDPLLVHDQLLKEMKHNRAFRLRTFREGPLTFAPTYKYDRHANVYDSSEKHRVPAWCDRVLWRSQDEGRVALKAYRRWEPNVSDHRPVSAAFEVTVKKVVADAREREKCSVVRWWHGLEETALATARTFYGL